MELKTITDIVREFRKFADEQEKACLYDCRNLATDSLRAYADMIEKITGNVKKDMPSKTGPKTYKRPLLSIVVPCYNCQSTIQKFIASLQQQSQTTGWEVLLVDDHSTDHTVETIQRCLAPVNFRAPDTRFRFVTNSMKGAGSARNLGIDKTSGNYLWFMDSDDYVASSWVLETVINAIETNPKTDLFTVNCAAVNELGIGVKGSFTNMRCGSDLYDKTLTQQDFVENFKRVYPVIGFPPWNKIVRRDFINSHGIRFQNTPFGNDQYFSIRCMMESNATYMISGDPVYCWLNAGRFHTSNSKMKLTHPEVYNVILEGLKQNCKWPNEQIRKEVLEDRLERFKHDTLRMMGRC